MPIVAKEQHATPPPQNKAPAKKRNKDDESWAMDLLGDLGEEIDELAKEETVAPKNQAAKRLLLLKLKQVAKTLIR